ncbi:AI-2E family transporter [Micromonospora zhanjiangensis]|uniref:AI-2E family transporter n=1 Tax=Micromonospora zhanjiangensis TaxID=1522057 RepID=A0ABV8KG34_9ACTN
MGDQEDPDSGAMASRDAEALARQGTPVGGGEAIASAETEAAETRSADAPLGRPGRRLDRRSPYLLGLLGAAGVATTYALVELLVAARGVLILIAVALFLAIGLDPAVRLLERRMPRWAAVTVVVCCLLAVVGGFLAVAIPALISQVGQLTRQLPRLLAELRDHSTLIGRANDHFHLQKRLEEVATGNDRQLAGGVVVAGRLVLGATTATVTALVLTIYFLVDLPRIRQLIYRMFPHSRRPRAILLGDEMFAKIGGFVLGNLLTSLIAGLGTFLWLVIFGVPYPLLLALMVALLDLVPIIGSTVGGIVVTLVAFSVSLPVALATLAYYIVFRLTEDYLLVPKIVGRVVRVPATLTFVAVLIGGVSLGIVGALIAIPVAASIRIVLEETVFPRLDRS